MCVCGGGGEEGRGEGEERGGRRGAYLSLTFYILEVPGVRGEEGRQTACHLQEDKDVCSH